MSFWEKQRVLVTGGSGFLGSHLMRLLQAQNCGALIAPRSSEYDLVKGGEAERLIADTRPTLLFHLAAICGGIGVNRAHPSRFFYGNAMMGIQLIEEARKAGVEKAVIVGTICAYPKFTPVPFKEEDLWSGYPEETNAPYGLAKKMLLVQAQACRQEFGSNFIYLLPVNLYGPGDNFNLETSHVIPALIRKMEDARLSGAKDVVLWGTGGASREFLFVEDCARGMLRAAEKYHGAEPINLGAGFEITIRELAEKIKKLTGFTGDIIWDETRPDGQPRRMLDVSRAEREFGFCASTTLDEGLLKTIASYRSEHAK